MSKVSRLVVLLFWKWCRNAGDWLHVYHSHGTCVTVAHFSESSPLTRSASLRSPSATHNSAVVKITGMNNAASVLSSSRADSGNIFSMRPLRVRRTWFVASFIAPPIFIPSPVSFFFSFQIQGESSTSTPNISRAVEKPGVRAVENAPRRILTLCSTLPVGYKVPLQRANDHELDPLSYTRQRGNTGCTRNVIRSRYG